MKILFVAMAESIHTQRWISQLANSGNDVRIFPSIDYGYTHTGLKDIHVYHTFYGRSGNNPHVVKHGVYLWLDSLADLARQFTYLLLPHCQELYLAKVIRDFNPDIIHSLEMQAGGSLVYNVKKHCQGKFPSWIVTNWGSDIYLFGKNVKHAKVIRAILKHCDYYLCECNRDVNLAREFGFKGEVLAVLPNAGGYDLIKFSPFAKTPASSRYAIMLKGYQGWAGRSLVALDALKKVGKTIRQGGYRLILYSTQGNAQVESCAKQISTEFGIPLQILPSGTSHQRVMKAHGQSRISIGLSLGDGISTSLLESMCMGSFPIQSYTACADEWLIDGVTGILVPPEDPHKVALALSKAIKNDQLVDKAKMMNERTIKERASYALVRKQALALYNKVNKKQI